MRRAVVRLGRRNSLSYNLVNEVAICLIFIIIYEYLAAVNLRCVRDAKLARAWLEQQK